MTTRPAVKDTTLTPEAVEQIQREDEAHVPYLTTTFPAGRLLRRKALAEGGTVSYFALEDGGELSQTFVNGAMTSELWRMANGDTLQRSYTADGRTYAMTVQLGTYAYTNFYDPQMQIAKKMEQVQGDTYCTKYERGRPATRELGACSNDDFREYEDQAD